MTTTPHRPEPSSATPEERRSKQLLFLLLLPSVVTPVVFWLIEVGSGADLFGSKALSMAQTGLMAGTNAAVFCGLLVLMVPWFSNWYGLPSWSRGRSDEREVAIFNKATRMATIASIGSLLVAYLITLDMKLMLILGIVNAAFYVSYVAYSRKS